MKIHIENQAEDVDKADHLEVDAKETRTAEKGKVGRGVQILSVREAIDEHFLCAIGANGRETVESGGHLFKAGEIRLGKRLNNRFVESGPS